MVTLVSRETRKFSDLCKRYFHSSADAGGNPELEKLREGLRTKGILLRRLAAQALNCKGAYHTVVNACRAVALAEMKLKGVG